MSDDAVALRRAEPDDRDQILALLAVALGRDDDPRFEQLLAWKHEDNPFGPSPAWVAHAGARIVGYRALMRWRFERDGQTVDAVRAVDTATDPGYQGQRIFTRLTLEAVEALRTEGVGFVFNTPNDKSRPGYLKMGWREVGRLPISVRPLSLGAPARIARARVPAARWSEACDAGDAAATLRTATDELGHLLASQPPSRELRTARTPEFLLWRYATDLVPYRVVVARGGVADGVALFRVRRRGPAREVVVAEVLAHHGDPATARELLRRVRSEVSADYLMRIGGGVVSREGFVRLPRLGPILTWRALAEEIMPPVDRWGVSLGDIELF